MVLVVVGDFHSVRILSVPTKAHSELVVDPDAVLSCPTSFQCFEPVAWREAQFGEGRGSFELG